tara:strand:+ start:1301 stop:2815 length:1515 start_codon:yes stop_codon:yes gene_type:complete
MTFQYSWDFLKAKKKKKKSKTGTKYVRLQGGGRGGAKLQSLSKYITDVAKNKYLREEAPNLGPEIFKKPTEVPPLKDGLDRSKPKNQIMIDRHSQATNEYERKMKNYRHFWDKVNEIKSELNSYYYKNGHDAFMRKYKDYAKPASEVGKLTGAESRAAKTGRMDALDNQLTSEQMEAEKPVDPIEYLKNRLASKTPESESDVNSLMTGLLSQMGPDALSDSEQKELRNVLTQKYNIQPESMADKLKRELNVQRRQPESRTSKEEMMADLDKLPEDIDFQTGSKALLEGFQPQGMQDINKKAHSLLSLMNPEERTDDSWGKIRNALAQKYGFDVPEASPAANIAAANLARNPILPKPSEEKPPVMPPQGQMTLDQFGKPPTRKPPVRVSRPVQEKVKEPAQLAQEQSDRRFDERQAKTEQFFAPEPTPAPSDELTDEQRAKIAQAYPDVKPLQPDMPDIFDAGGNLSQTMPEPSPSSQGAGSSEVIGNLFDQMMDNFRREQGAGQ